MAEITLFVALPFDFDDDGGIAAGEPVDCPSPCACRKSSPDILVMQSTQDWTAQTTRSPAVVLVGMVAQWRKMAQEGRPIRRNRCETGISRGTTHDGTRAAAPSGADPCRRLV
jgi:hypothetical protein